MNKIFCASMAIRFEEQKLASFSVYTKPDAQFIPPHELTPEARRLAGFAWRADERPTLYDVAAYLNPDYDPNLLVPVDSVKKSLNNDLEKMPETLRDEMKNYTPGLPPIKKPNQTLTPTQREAVDQQSKIKRDLQKDDGIQL